MGFAYNGSKIEAEKTKKRATIANNAVALMFI